MIPEIVNKLYILLKNFFDLLFFKVEIIDPTAIVYFFQRQVEKSSGFLDIKFQKQIFCRNVALNSKKDLYYIFISEIFLTFQSNVRFCKLISNYTRLFSSSMERNLNIKKASYIISIYICFFIQINSIICDETENIKSVDSQNQNSYKKDSNQIQVKGLRDRNSASEGIVTSTTIKFKPLYNTGEIAEVVPGVISTGHSGGGKANQYFLRGFNLDHGTDFSSSVDGVVINNPSHTHGQGYNDMNFVVPELIQEVKYRKGVYSVEDGNFSSAGSMNIKYFTTLKSNYFKLEGGSFGHRRALSMNSFKSLNGDFLVVGDVSNYNGPWSIPDKYKKYNSVLGYSYGDDSKGFSIKGSAYNGNWHATNQIPERAIDKGKNSYSITDTGLNRFDSGDPSDAGKSNRFNLLMEAHKNDSKINSKILFYNVYYDLDLYSNFTFYLKNPQRGDQIQQKEFRTTTGMSTSHSLNHTILDFKMVNTFGLQVRRDYIQNGLYESENKTRFDKLKENRIRELNISPYYENQIKWSEKLKTVLGVRGEFFNFLVEDRIGLLRYDEYRDTNILSLSSYAENPKFKINENANLINPKGSIVLGPYLKTELFFNAGYGFHSNDARGLFRADSKVTPLSRTKGKEVGIHNHYFRNLSTNLVFWTLDLESELIFLGDTGSTEPTRGSTRKGIEFNTILTITQNLSLVVDLSTSKAKFTQYESSGDIVPLSARNIFYSALMYSTDKWSSSINYKYFGSRPLTEDDSIQSSRATIVNGMVSTVLYNNWVLRAEIFNLLNSRIDRIQYYYPTRLRNEPVGPEEGGYNDRIVSPFPGRNFRISVTYNF